MCCASYVKSYYICKVIFMLLLCYLILLERVEPPTKFSKRGDLTGPQLVDGVCWEREGVTFFRGGGGVNFHIKNKILNV